MVWAGRDSFFTYHIKNKHTMKLKEIKGFEGLYAADTINGDIYSLNYKRTNSIKKLKPADQKGYGVVYLRKEGKTQKHYLHRLIWMAEYGEISQGLTIDHIDSNKENNSISNLQLMSRQANISKAHLGKVAWNKGKQLSEEHKQKILESRKRYFQSLKLKGKINP